MAVAEFRGVAIMLVIVSGGFRLECRPGSLDVRVFRTLASELLLEPRGQLDAAGHLALEPSAAYPRDDTLDRNVFADLALHRGDVLLESYG